MADNNRDAIESVASRLEKARSQIQDPLTKPTIENNKNGNVLGLAFRVAVEIVSAVGIGFGAGWLLDDWLGTKPWLMVLFVIIGFAAGVLNVYRMASGFSYSAGYPSRDKNMTGHKKKDEDN